MSTITLTPTKPRRERILAYGSESAGKSYMWQCILAATPPEVQFHVIDTDGAWEPAKVDPQFAPHADRVTVTEPDDWVDYVNAIKHAKKTMERDRGDWFVLDMADQAWTAAQDYYEDRKFAGDMDTVEFMEALVDGNLETDREDNMARWGTINKLYAPMRHMMVRVPGNLFVCASAKELKKDKSGNYFRERRKDVKDFGRVGYRPAGQKNLSHDVNTVMFLTKRGDRRQFQVTKDRNREHAWEGEFTRGHKDITRDMLMPVAGWEPNVG